MIRFLICSQVLGALGYCGARWFEPWIGPMLMQPCPLPTPLGCIVAGVGGFLWGGAIAVEMNLTERKRARMWSGK